jgi:hypothetical protein
LRRLIRGGTVLDFSFIRELKIRMKMEKEAAMVMSIFKILQVMQDGHINT